MNVPAPAWPSAPALPFDPREETLRLEELRSLHLIDTEPEERFDRITQLAARYFEMPTAYVAFIDGDRQWFKSRIGLCPSETPRAQSFCQYTIAQGAPLIIPDTFLDPIGRNHPFVLGEPHLRFYAGVPLSGPGGRKVGSFCLTDIVPRTFGEQAVRDLRSFAAMVEREIGLGEVIQAQNDLLVARHELVETKNKLEHEFTDAAKYVRQMLPPPLSGAETIDWFFEPSTHLGGDGLGYRRIDDDMIAFYILDVTGHGLGSALLAVTALELLRNRNPAAQIDFYRPSAVIDRLNRSFQMKDHGGKFFSAWYGVYSKSRQTLTYSNAGHPPPLLLSRVQGEPRLTRTEPGCSVLGVSPAIGIPETTVDFAPGSEIFLFTDGLYEVADAKGGRGSYDEFLDYLQGSARDGSPVWAAIRAWQHEASGRKQIDDDVSMLRFTTSAARL